MKCEKNVSLQNSSFQSDLHWKKWLVKPTFFLLVSTKIFFVDVTTQVIVITIEIVTPAKKIVVLTNKIAEAYFTNQSSWFH